MSDYHNLAKVVAMRKIWLIVIFGCQIFLLSGQETLRNPVSLWTFNPIVINPATVGRNDFLSVDFLLTSDEKLKSYNLAGNTRLLKKVSGYSFSHGYSKYSNFGVGGYLFYNKSDLSQSLGVSSAGALHIKLREKSHSYLSFGISVKGLFNTIDTLSLIEPGVITRASQTFNESVDFGIYYYDRTFYVGISSTNLLWSDNEIYNPGSFIPDARQYFLIGGYKFILNRNHRIVLEPSIIVSAYDSTFQDVANNINPLIRLYFEDFCIGTYFNYETEITFFFQYNYPRIRIGAFFGMPIDMPYYKKEPSIGISLGINLSYNEARPYKRYHW